MLTGRRQGQQGNSKVSYTYFSARRVANQVQSRLPWAQDTWDKNRCLGDFQFLGVVLLSMKQMISKWGNKKACHAGQVFWWENNGIFGPKFRPRSLLCEPHRTRTCNQGIKSPLLYRIELAAQRAGIISNLCRVSSCGSATVPQLADAARRVASRQSPMAHPSSGRRRWPSWGRQ